VLALPEGRYPQVGARIMNLQDPGARMSTTYGSEQGTVYILDDPDAVRSKVRSAVTDSGTDVQRAPDKPGITNLIEILAVVRGVDPDAVEREFAGSGYGEFKSAVAEAVVGYLAPVRERYGDLRADEAELESVLSAGAEKARAIAAETLADVRERMGLSASEPSPRGAAGR
jgi:tryptophanyl-tRNA synthetase